MQQFPEKTTTLNKIKPGPQQVRRKFEPEAMMEMVRTIRESGLLNPPIVYAENGHYLLLAGERRTRALNALALITDGYSEAEAVTLVCQDKAWDNLEQATIRSRIAVPVRIVPAEMDLEAISLIENLQRVNLNAIEEAEGYHKLYLKYNKNVRQVAKVTGKSALLIEARLALLELEPEIQEYMAKKQLSKDVQVTKELLSLPAETRLQLARRFVEKGSSIKAIVAACRKVRDALAQTQKPERVVVAVKEATVTIAPVVVAPVQVRCFCPGCAGLVQGLAEELCAGCLEGGLSPECLNCPGVIEFVEGLIKRVNGHAA